MRRRLRHRPTPATVISLIALVVAMGGTSYAAISLPANSVGTTQLKKKAVTRKKLAANAVTSAKVKNGALLAKDFKAGQLPAGPRGPMGLTGPAGPKGDKGAKGDRGPSDAFDRTNTFSLENLPAGSYELIGKMGVTGITGNGSLSCDLTATPTSGGASTSLDHAAMSATTSAGTTNLALPLVALKTFSTPQNLLLSCFATGSGVNFDHPQLTAIQVGTIH